MIQQGDLVFYRVFDTVVHEDTVVWKVYKNPGIILEVVEDSDLVKVRWQKKDFYTDNIYIHREDVVRVNHPNMPQGDHYLMFVKG